MTVGGVAIPLSEVARVYIAEGPDMIRSENACLNGWVFIDIARRDLSTYVQEAQRAVKQHITLPQGYSLAWSGQYEYLERAKERLALVAPLTIAIIFLLLYLCFRRVSEAIIILTTVPFALVGGLWLVYLLGYHLSIAVGIGFIALAGVAAETGVIMLIYLNQALAKHQQLAKKKSTFYKRRRWQRRD